MGKVKEWIAKNFEEHGLIRLITPDSKDYLKSEKPSYERLFDKAKDRILLLSPEVLYVNLEMENRTKRSLADLAKKGKENGANAYILSEGAIHTLEYGPGPDEHCYTCAICFCKSE